MKTKRLQDEKMMRIRSQLITAPSYPKLTSFLTHTHTRLPLLPQRPLPLILMKSRPCSKYSQHLACCRDQCCHDNYTQPRAGMLMRQEEGLTAHVLLGSLIQINRKASLTKDVNEQCTLSHSVCQLALISTLQLRKMTMMLGVDLLQSIHCSLFFIVSCTTMLGGRLALVYSLFIILNSFQGRQTCTSPCLP